MISKQYWEDLSCNPAKEQYEISFMTPFHKLIKEIESKRGNHMLAHVGYKYDGDLKT